MAIIKAMSRVKLLSLFAIILLQANTYAKGKNTDYIVVIDPGHGGHDSGAVFVHKKKTYKEKDLTLLLAKDISTQLDSLGFQTHLTRTQDSELDLADRTAFANKIKAHVFISVHLNSASSTGAHGVETYLLNSTTDQSSKRLADLENSVLKESKVADATESSNIALIVKDMILEANLKTSKELACSVQNKMSEVATDRGVHQALFYVLLGADMPAVLVEAGFINHLSDRERILNSTKRKKFAEKIAKGVQDFRHRKKDAAIQSKLDRCKVRGG